MVSQASICIVDPRVSSRRQWCLFMQRVVELLRHQPALIRGNASEIMAVAGSAGAGGRGTDSTVGAEAALEAGKQLALKQKCVVAISGATDLVRHVLECRGFVGVQEQISGTGCALLCDCSRAGKYSWWPLQVTDGRRVVRVCAGHPNMQQITATGCTVTAVIAAFLAADQADPLLAAAHALCIYGAQIRKAWWLRLAVVLLGQLLAGCVSSSISLTACKEAQVTDACDALTAGLSAEAFFAASHGVAAAPASLR